MQLLESWTRWSPLVPPPLYNKALLALPPYAADGRTTQTFAHRWVPASRRACEAGAFSMWLGTRQAVRRENWIYQDILNGYDGISLQILRIWRMSTRISLRIRYTPRIYGYVPQNPKKISDISGYIRHIRSYQIISVHILSAKFPDALSGRLSLPTSHTSFPSPPPSLFLFLYPSTHPPIHPRWSAWATSLHTILFLVGIGAIGRAGDILTWQREWVSVRL